jgi:OpgC protein
MDQDFSLTTTKKSERIISLDIIRGLFLAIILINHIELYPNFFDLFTGRGRLLVSAAEGFFFMSGLLVGMVYRRRLSRGFKFVFKKMWRRAAELYLGSVMLTLLFTGAAIYLSHPTIKDGLYPVTDWPGIIKNTLLMHYDYGWADFLDRFAIMMLMAPFAFYLLARSKWWLMLIISIALWAGPGNNNPLDTLNWQIIFNLGMLIGYHWHELKQRLARVRPVVIKRTKRAILTLTAITFLLSYASVYVLSLLNQKLGSLSPDWQQFTLHWNSANAYIWRFSEKWTVGPLRIVLFGLWFASLFMIVERYGPAINRYTKNVLLMFGQNSLFVYIAHAFIVFGFKYFINPGHPLFINFLITAAALASLIAVTWIYTRLRPAAQPSHHPRQPQSTNRTALKAELAES